jgi:hypothetical protein
MARFVAVLSLIRPFDAICVVIVLAATAHTQIRNLDDTTTPPTPGVGHDYIKMLRETVNPANGSVSLRQWAGTDESAFSGLVCRATDRVGAHSAREANAERARRELPRTAAFPVT